jgi:uncharacterized protein (TIGR02996 family)
MLPPTQLALLRAIEAEPDDDLPRLAYADWLEEEGDELDRMHAKLIRSQVLLGTHLEDLPAWFQAISSVPPARILERIDELSEYAPLQRRIAGVWSGACNAVLVFWKGFVDEVRFDSCRRVEPYREQFLASGSPLLTAGPLPRRFRCVDDQPALFRARYWWVAGDSLVHRCYVPSKVCMGLRDPIPWASPADLVGDYATVHEAKEDLDRAAREFILSGLREGRVRQ